MISSVYSHLAFEENLMSMQFRARIARSSPGFRVDALVEPTISEQNRIRLLTVKWLELA